MNITHTKEKVKIRREKEKKVPIPNQDSLPQKHRGKKEIAIPGTLMTGRQASLIPLVQPLNGMARDILHGWRQLLLIWPPIRHTLFWILAVHDQLDQERQLEDSKSMRCIMALQQSFALATSPLCLPTLRWRLVGKVASLIFRRNLHSRPELMCWKQVMCLSYSHFLKLKIWE